MRWKPTAVIAACAVLVTAFALPADAQPRQRVVQGTQAPTVFTSRDEDGRTRTRIIVQKRSYLDPGTESLPGQGHNTDYVRLPGQRPTDILGPGRNYDRTPLNNWFDYGFNR